MNPKKSETRSILITLALTCLILSFIFRSGALALGSAVFIALVIAGGKPAFFVAAGWKRAAAFIGNFNARLMLFAAFYLFLTPLAALYRLFNKTSYRRFRVNDRYSYFEVSNRLYAKDDFKKMW